MRGHSYVHAFASLFLALASVACSDDGSSKGTGDVTEDLRRWHHSQLDAGTTSPDAGSTSTSTGADASVTSDAGSPPPPTTTDAGAAPFDKPALVNPVSPMQYGAKCDGVTDDSAAFQAAVNASDVLVPAATCVINHPVTISVSNRHLECAAGGTIKQTDGFAGRVFNIRSWSTTERLTGDSIVNCHFVGANTDPPQYYGTDNRHWNIPVQTQDRVDDFLLAGNTFEKFFGQSMFQTYGQVDGGNGDKIVYNTFRACGYYGPVLVAHTNGLIAHNTMIDCSTGVENDDTTQKTGGNVIEYNTLTGVHGYGAPDMGASVMLTGGAAAGANYSTNIVRYNTVSGVSDALGFQGANRPSEIYEQAPGGAAQYVGNTCGTGCRVVY